ncbi:MAG: hypothetical protein WBB31_12035 [Saprospiraceae bacterium]
MHEKRIARLCWNDNGYIMPSGRVGKSKNIDTHEAKYGYGHEEWLFDIGKLINGYHYGFLEPIRKQQDAYANKTYDVLLYNIDGKSKRRYWIGEIKSVEVLSKEHALKIQSTYRKKKWLSEMQEQIKSSNASARDFSRWKGVDLFNIRFKPENLKLNDPYFDVPKNNHLHNLSRYSFTHFTGDLFIPNMNGVFRFQSSENSYENESDVPETIKYEREPKAIEILYLHKAISKSLTKELKKQYGNENVTPEHPSGTGGCKIDIVVNDKGKMLFYEIKTYTSMKSSIREAIGQLMEYALWTNQKRAIKFIVVTQPHGDCEQARVYFKHLRDTYKIPLYFQTYDKDRHVLSEMF